MNPLTHDRITWLEERIFTLGRMINELSSRPGRYHTRPQFAAQHPIVLSELVAEQLKLNVELNVTREYLEAQDKASVAITDAHGDRT